MRAIDADELINEIRSLPNFGIHWFVSAKQVFDLILNAPTIESDLDEWCTDCKEYDQERHCCPRWNRVIRTTLNDMKGENNDTSLDN